MRVLIPVQDSIFGDAITDFIAGHKWQKDAEFKLLSVIEYESYGEMLGDMYCCDVSRSFYDQRVCAATKLLEQYALKLDRAMPGASVEHRVRYGDPKNIILDEADQWQADMIVMGSHARRGMSRFLLGSVSMAVLSHSRCSVVIVKLPQTAPARGARESTRSACVCRSSETIKAVARAPKSSAE